MDYSRYEHLKVEVEDRVALVTLNRPDVLNAVNNRMHTQLTEIWRDINRDSAVNIAVVTGAGSAAFSAGGDLGDLEERDALPAGERFDSVMDLAREVHEIVYSIVNCDKPIISAINGVAVGAGLAVALLADISIMAEDGRLTDGHTRLGVAAGDHSAVIWPLLCGMAKAKYYLLTCDFIDGREAERIGLVSKAVPRAEVLSTAMAIARRLADGPQPALRLTKRALNQWIRLAGVTSFDYSVMAEMMGFFSSDVTEGLRALRERRQAEFPSAHPRRG
jgi:enoyl-CoA hydratase